MITGFLTFLFFFAIVGCVLYGRKSQSSPKILSSIRGKKISEIVLKREAK